MAKKLESLKGVLPSIDCEIFIAAKNGQSSVRITKALLDKAMAQATKLGKKPKVTVTIPANDQENYTFTFLINKQRKI